MKIRKFNESSFIPSNDEEMKNFIYDIISSYVDIRTVEYHPDDYEADPESEEKAAEQIIIELKKLGVDFDFIYNVKKYNV